jgi:putative phosphoesterase
MQIAFISDIHGNYDALKAVLKNIRKLRINKIYCLGDIVNYYYEPHKCINIFIKKKVESIKGNHENIFFKILKDKKKINYYSKLYGNSININLKKLKKKHINFLKETKKTLTIKIKKLKIILAHGSPWSSNTYIYPNFTTKIKNSLAKYKADYIFLGHTHIPMNIKINKKTSVINPGSVGQPRNRCNNACWAIFDTEKRAINFIETKYKKKKLIQNINKYEGANSKLKKYFLN